MILLITNIRGEATFPSASTISCSQYLCAVASPLQIQAPELHLLPVFVLLEYFLHFHGNSVLQFW